MKLLSIFQIVFQLPLFLLEPEFSTISTFLQVICLKITFAVPWSRQTNSLYRYSSFFLTPQSMRIMSYWCNIPRNFIWAVDKEESNQWSYYRMAKSKSAESPYCSTGATSKPSGENMNYMALAPQARQARASGENLNYVTLAPQARQVWPNSEIFNFSLSL